MKKLFGTDGIRGKANCYPITPELALLVGKGTAKVLGADCGSGRRRVVLGKDTRISGYMLENAITSGLLSMGMDVLAVGPMPTPAVAHLTKSMGAACGIMITASHNPASDNGIKIFASDGFKLPDEVEMKIEQVILSEEAGGEHVPCEKIGKGYRIDDARGRYIEFAKGSIRNLSLRGLKIVLDCANGHDVVAPRLAAGLAGEIRRRAEPEGPVLSPREREVLTMIAAGSTIPAMAKELYLAPSTVKTHVQRLYEKLGVSDRAAAVAEAMRRKLLD